jgi:hypothetical protein
MAQTREIVEICMVVQNPSHIHWAGSPENILAQ